MAPPGWRAEGHAAFEAAPVARLVRRLPEGRLLDVSAPCGGTVHALHHPLAAPDATRPEAAKIAARSRITKWIARRLRG